MIKIIKKLLLWIIYLVEFLGFTLIGAVTALELFVRNELRRV